MTKKSLQGILVTTALILGISVWAIAGSLTPPTGPVTSTMKTLVEVEPRIAINSTNTPGDAASVYKITQSGSYYLTENLLGAGGKVGIAIQSGNVSIDLKGFNLSGNGGTNGIQAFSGFNFIIRNGTVSNWTGAGINLQATYSGSVESISASNNVGGGIITGENYVVKDCTAISNTSDGIKVGSACTLTSCTARGNAGRGYFANSGNTLIGCAALYNTDDGYFLGTGSLIRDCTATANRGDGIQINGTTAVLNNNCTGNGEAVGDGAGIYATNFGANRIEGNNVTANDRGLDIDSVGNLIIGNSASSNTTNYDIGGGNTVGPTVNSGNIATSTNPHANYDY